VGLAYAAQESVKNPDQIDKFDRANHFGSDAEAEKPLGCEDVVGGRSRVPGYDQPAGQMILTKPVTPFIRYSRPAILAVLLVEFIFPPLLLTTLAR
jgi:hypothetical protein